MWVTCECEATPVVVTAARTVSLTVASSLGSNSAGGDARGRIVP